MGLDPGSPGPCPGLKAVLNLCIPCYFISFLKILFIYIHKRQKERQRHRQREKQAPGRELDVGLDPGSPGSRPRLKAALNR